MIVGLTGGIGSGKTTVAALLQAKGAFVIDTDAIAREVVQPNSPLLDAIRREFGPTLVSEEGELDRAALASIIFGDPDKRARLNQLMHPEILKRVLSTIGTQPAGVIVVVVVPLLFESQFERNCDLVAAVVAPARLRRERIAARDRLGDADIEARMRAQLPEGEHERRADVVIRNDGDLTSLEREVDRAWREISARSDPARRSAAEKR